MKREVGAAYDRQLVGFYLTMKFYYIIVNLSPVIELDDFIPDFTSFPSRNSNFLWLGWQQWLETT